MEPDETPQTQVPESHWLNSPQRRLLKARMFGQIGLVLWAVWLLLLWRQSDQTNYPSRPEWLLDVVVVQASFWLALLFTGVWVAATVARDERSRR